MIKPEEQSKTIVDSQKKSKNHVNSWARFYGVNKRYFTEMAVPFLSIMMSGRIKLTIQWYKDHMDRMEECTSGEYVK